jgi:hypothetical protein
VVLVHPASGTDKGLRFFHAQYNVQKSIVGTLLRISLSILVDASAKCLWTQFGSIAKCGAVIVIIEVRA